MAKRLGDLRSQRWFGATDLRSFGHRSRALQMGYAREDFLNKPVIGIINTWSDLAQCHTHFPERVEDIKRGHLAGRWLPGRIAGDVALGAVRQADQHAVPQLPRDGD